MPHPVHRPRQAGQADGIGYFTANPATCACGAHYDASEGHACHSEAQSKEPAGEAVEDDANTFQVNLTEAGSEMWWGVRTIGASRGHARGHHRWQPEDMP